MEFWLRVLPPPVRHHGPRSAVTGIVFTTQRNMERGVLVLTQEEREGHAVTGNNAHPVSFSDQWK